MEATSQNAKEFKVEVNELVVELEHAGFIPEWFQIEFGKMLNEIIKTNILELDFGNKEPVEEHVKETIGEKKNSDVDEYVNWEEKPEINNYAISGLIKYESKTKVAVQIYISRGEAIKFSRNYSYEVDSILDNMSEVLAQAKNFILSSCGKEDEASSLIDSYQYYPEIVKILEAAQKDKSTEKHFVTGLFLAKAGEEEKSLENLDYVINNSANPEMIQDCYKVVLAVKAKKNVKDIENAQNEVYKGDPNKAIPLIESLIQITPKYIHLHFLLGMAFKKSGFREKTIEAFKKALEIDSNNVPSLRELAEELMAVANVSEAESMYRRIVNLNQANATDYYNLGMCLKRLGKMSELDGIMDKIKELDVEGKLDSYLFSLFEVRPEHFKNESAGEKKSIWSKLFGKK